MASCVWSKLAESPSSQRLSKISHRHANPQLHQKQRRNLTVTKLHRIDHNAIILQNGFCFLKLPLKILVSR